MAGFAEGKGRVSGTGSDPLLTDDWVADPWDDAASLPADALETTPQGLDFLRGPMRNQIGRAHV